MRNKVLKINNKKRLSNGNIVLTPSLTLVIIFRSKRNNIYANDPYVIDCHNDVTGHNNIQELEREYSGYGL